MIEAQCPGKACVVDLGRNMRCYFGPPGPEARKRWASEPARASHRIASDHLSLRDVIDIASVDVVADATPPAWFPLHENPRSGLASPKHGDSFAVVVGVRAQR